MAIEFRCHNCQSLLRAGDDKAGRRAKCPHCGTTVQTPGRQPPPAADFDPYEEAEDYDGGSDSPSDPFTQHFGGGTRSPYVERQVSRQPTGTTTCPMCGEPIPVGAPRCRWCGELFNKSVRPSARQGFVRTSGNATASLILGIFSVVTFWLCYSGLPCSILAIALGIVGLNQTKSGEFEGQGQAMAGLILGIVGLVLNVAVLALIFPWWAL